MSLQARLVTDRGTARRGVVAFDNTGTLSRTVVEGRAVSDDSAFDAPVPDIPPERPTALVSVALDDYGAFDTDEPLGGVLAAEEVPVHLALSNVDVTVEAATAAVRAADEVPARAVVERVETLQDRVGASLSVDPPPTGVQLVTDLDAGRVHRVIAYTTRPRAVASEVVGRVRELGYEPRILSGDATHVLRGVAEAVAIPLDRVHAYQSADGKAAVIRALQADREGEVVMVGDYVNDRHAFEAADLAVLICENGTPDDALARRADRVVAGIEDVPDLLADDTCDR